MHPIYALWAVPRTTSTAFEWMMRMRGDLACFHEPFGEAWFRGEDAQAPRLSADAPRKAGLSSTGVWENLQRTAETHPVFIKCFPNYSDHLWGEAFLNRFTHSFLIRDPVKVLQSLQKSLDKSSSTDTYTIREMGFEEQRILFDLLCQRDGIAPPVIDSDDLLEDPPTMVAAYCAAIGIPFIPEALSWTPGDRKEVLWYDSDDSVWHASLRDSDGLKAQPRRPTSPDQVPERLKFMYEPFAEAYAHLHTHRVSPKM